MVSKQNNFTLIHVWRYVGYGNSYRLRNGFGCSSHTHIAIILSLKFLFVNVTSTHFTQHKNHPIVHGLVGRNSVRILNSKQ